jgi:zinc transport system substrate-binding protein
MNGFLPVESVMMDKVLAVNPKLKLIDTSVGIEVMEFSAEEGRDGGENHEEEDEHLHEDGIDPHFWTSPELVKQQLTNIEAGLIELNPENATTYKQNALNYLTKLDQMQSELAATLSPYEGKIMLVYHPAFGYFAREFGLRQVFFEFEGREPSLADYTRLIEEVDQEQVKVLFIQKQHNTEAANKIADEFGLAVVVVDPLAENYLENMQVLTAIISESL